jgi:FixJ family two-component response regulator
MSHPVHVVDDDASVRRAFERQLRAHGWGVKTYASAAEFEASSGNAAPGCLLLDLCMTDASGLDLLAHLAEAGTALGVVIVSGHGDVVSTVRAMRLGALDFLTKPVDEVQLLEAVGRAMSTSVGRWREYIETTSLRQRLQRLTPREREVCALVASGMLNKQIAHVLGTSEKTVKVHRGRVMSKLEVPSLAHLVRLFDRITNDDEQRSGLRQS